MAVTLITHRKITAMKLVKILVSGFPKDNWRFVSFNGKKWSTDKSLSEVKKHLEHYSIQYSDVRLVDFIEDALSKITLRMCQDLESGAELELNEKYTLYHYIEDDVIVVNETEGWEETYQVLWDNEGHITFESLV